MRIQENTCSSLEIIHTVNGKLAILITLLWENFDQGLYKLGNVLKMNLNSSKLKFSRIIYSKSTLVNFISILILL